MISFEQFSHNLASVQTRMAAACKIFGRAPESVVLLPVTKNHPVDAVIYADRAGLKAVGENRVQEAAQKHGQTDIAVRWELIGHLQSNKAKSAVELFDRVQSVDSLKLLERLNRQAAEIGKKLPILLQCNTGEDPNKHGFMVGEMAQALEQALAAESLQVDGLMTIAPLDDDLDVAKAAFIGLRELRDDLAAQFGVALPELSMGMTGDLEVAIAAGSTQIRVGTALYGARQY
ncbi:MAG: YggS family pyridoxal phosphate-dependent enzyme [Opitutales bacterium]|jgi:PLP dependent protein|nr:YggS family pyridoxal phosphate-dependent enzyme [Opitutales bacterium]MDP4643635.1 YggS family pyridoxal phosphate-dependent enzyme [Opitutales bacterium]MDP4693345.1 YggS family pyridoxal phosphate-dependent enzyme [Opitutales bacterium]MDP4776815.1 YggS family pyridoxal phosphate-dependent enzyme [Opitutales bacterium]MDP4884568.1 YggS family pyridoxal phosphate-dependent enzyme [Opitutales bacterium]